MTTSDLIHNQVMVTRLGVPMKDGTYSAIEIKRGETYLEVLKHFMEVAADLSIRFEQLQVCGIIEVGSRKFLRVFSDCPTFPPIIHRFRTESRSFIGPVQSGGFRVFLSDGKVGTISVSKLLGVNAPGYGQTYRGTKVKFWERQFEGV